MAMKLPCFMLTGLLFSLALGTALSPFASSSPDGLEKVTEKEGFLRREVGERHAWTGSPFPEYTVGGIENERASTAVAGFVGTLVTFGAGLAIAKVIRAGRKDGCP